MANPVSISIVTPSFNHAPFLRDTIESVLGQGYPALEYIVIDGASSDGSADIIRSYADRLHHWESVPDRGHAHAINKGFARSGGEVMAWLNSDDMYLPWTLHTVGEIFDAYPEVEWLCGLNGTWDSRGRLVGVRDGKLNLRNYLLGDYGDDPELARHGFIQQESVFWRRSLWERAGAHVSEELRLAIDGELWSRFFLHAPLHYLHCVIAGYRVHRGNRAQLHLQELRQEMDAVIDALRASDHGVTRAELAYLGMIRATKRVPGLRRLPLDGLGRRLFRQAYRRATHPTLYPKEGAWVMGEDGFVA